MTDPSSAKHPIRVVAQRTGLKTDLIRAWERRYSAIKPQRSEGRHRFYSDRDIERLILLRDAASSTRSIGRLAGLSDDALRRLIEDDRRAAETSVPVAASPGLLTEKIHRPASSGDLRTFALDAAARLDSAALTQAFDQATLQLGFSRSLTDLVEPLLQDVDGMRRERRLRRVHESFVESEIRAFVQATMRRTADPAAPRAVVSTPLGRPRETRALLVAAHAVGEGWQSIYLGTALPADEIAAAARACRAALVLLDLSALPDAPSAEEEIDRLRRRLGAGHSIVVFESSTLSHSLPDSAPAAGAPAAGAPAATLSRVTDVAELKEKLAQLRARPVWRTPTPSRAGVGRLGHGRELPVTAASRRRYRLDASLFNSQGGLRLGSLRAVRRLAHQMRTADPESTGEPIYAGELQAAALLYEVADRDSLLHAERRGGTFFESLWTKVAREVDDAGILLEAFQARFPPNRLSTPPTEGRFEIPQWELLRRLLLTRLLCANPACSGARRLFDDQLDGSQAYAAVEKAVANADAELLETLSAALNAHPSSLEGQLQYLLDSHPDLPEDLVDRLWLCLDVLHEERAPTWEERRTRPSPPPTALIDPPTSPVARRTLPLWAPDVVLQTKIVPIWLSDLSRRYGRPVEALEQIPDEALQELAERGFNALWLVGIWRRGAASAKIKQAAGRADAISSAYAVDSYDVAPNLGGRDGLDALKRRAARYGLRLACDMVPNHTALDSRWVVEHPERFIQTSEPPYPSYTYSGPDLSDDPRVSVFLEDHYADRSDAAVVFRRVDRETGEVSFIYHGNDGTALPWNDTAQLDYTREDVRRLFVEQVVRLAQDLPIVRLDAAMTLIREHFQRLWFPEPGKGGAIPSRAELSMSRERFYRLMPREIWAEVLQEVERRAPDSLLIAEAFWLTESYFIDHLGMDRVYDSALLHRVQEGRSGEIVEELKTALQSRPSRLECMVRFLTNPDLPTAAETFGTGDRYMAACTLVVTLPGLPLFGHGQWDGRREAFAMDAAAPRRDESPDEATEARHHREIVPLLQERTSFCRAESLRVFDTAEPVVAFVNGPPEARRLVVVNLGNHPSVAHLHRSALFLQDGTLQTCSLPDALALPPGTSQLVDPRFGTAFPIDAEEAGSRGWSLPLEPWQAVVLQLAP